MARFGTLTVDEEIERELLEREELAQQLVLLDQDSRRLNRQADRAESTASFAGRNSRQSGISFESTTSN